MHAGGLGLVHAGGLVHVCRWFSACTQVVWV